MSMNDLIQFITQNGFAIVVAIYMLTSMNKTLSDNTAATNKMCDLIQSFLSVIPQNTPKTSEKSTEKEPENIPSNVTPINSGMSDKNV